MATVKPHNLERFYECQRWFWETNRHPSKASTDPAEKRLAEWFRGRLSVSSDSFDPAIREWWEKNKMRNRIPYAERFQACKDFYAQHGRIPSGEATGEELTLSHWLVNAMWRVGDHEVREWFQTHKKIRPFNEAFDSCKQWFEEHGRLPSETSSDPKESYLGLWLNRRARPTHALYNPEVGEWRKAHKVKLSEWRKAQKKLLTQK